MNNAEQTMIATDVSHIGITKDNILSVLKSVNNRYITHFATDSYVDSLLIMEQHGKSFGRLYWYGDDNTTVYLDRLSVDVNARRQGLGTELQIIREKIGIEMGAESACLFVEKNMWMYEWYKRRGYEYYTDYEYEKNISWMKKML